MNEVIELFMENPEKEYYLREISKKLKISPATVSKKIDSKIINSRKVSNHIFYSLKENEKVRSLKRVYNFEKIMKSGIVEHLVRKMHPKAIFLFGSYAKGDNISSSDIDIFVMSSKKEVDVSKFGNIQLIVKKDLKLSNELLNNVVNGMRLYGQIEI